MVLHIGFIDWNDNVNSAFPAVNAVKIGILHELGKLNTMK